ncbi:MAG: hypothetical protein ACP5OJ_06185 [Methanothermobacter sp.]
MSGDVIEQFKKEYEGIQRIEKEENALIIYADDDTLWKILEDLRDDFNMEFEAGTREDNFIRIMKN